MSAEAVWIPILLFGGYIVCDGLLWWLTLKRLEMRIAKLEKLNAIGDALFGPLPREDTPS